MSYEDIFKTTLQAIGAVSLVYLSHKFVSFHSLWLIPTRSLSHYQQLRGPWALVTGASAGIGRGCAEELAARGFNIILLGHLPDELELVQKHINQESPNAEVKVIVLNVTQATNPKIEAALNECKDLPITVLVNNVGGVPTGILDFADCTAVELDRTINLNARFMTQCTRIMLPVLAKNGPSLMMNLSSVGRLGMPCVVPYSATKAYVAGLSRGLARERKVNGEKVDIVAVLPVEVATETNHQAQAPGTPTSRAFAKAMMAYVPRAAQRGWLELCPYWLHAVQMAILERMPEWMFLKSVMGSFNKKKALSKVGKVK